MHDFFYNVRNAYWASLAESRVHAGGPATGSAVRPRLWVTPAAVEGFRVDDFWFLPAEQRDALARSVEGFRSVAIAGSPDQLPTEAQAVKAYAHLAWIAKILRLDEYTQAERYRTSMILDNCRSLLRAAVEPNIVELVFEIEEDSEREGLTVWVVLEDSVTDSDEFFGTSDRIREKLQEMLRVYGVPYWPHIRFRSRTEQAELVEAYGS